MMGHQAGRSIMELVFLQSLQAESASLNSTRLHTGAFLWDLSNYYEHVDHDILWERAEKQHYPLAVLAIVLNQYSGRRFLGYSGICIRLNFPYGGIAAGCSFATYLVQVFSLPPLRTWIQKNPEVDLTLFIDDFLGMFSHKCIRTLVNVLTHAAASLSDLIVFAMG